MSNADIVYAIQGLNQSIIEIQETLDKILEILKENNK